jgi:hypothetical protein
LAVKVAVVGSNPGALKKPLAEKITPTPSPAFSYLARWART